MTGHGIWGRYVGRLQKTGTRMALGALFSVILGVAGYRLNWYPFGYVVNLLMIASGCALMALVMSALALVSAKHAPQPLPIARKAALTASFLGATIFLVVLGSYARRGKSVPMIHDITTDTESPPKFEFVLPRRSDATNTAEYEGPAVAALQKKSYPNVKPLVLQAEPTIAYLAALELARRKWEIVVAEPHRGRIEATATSRIFGFKDDIVIRVQADGAGSKVDMRSLSRVGKSDLGVNAERIETFLSELKKSL